MSEPILKEVLNEDGTISIIEEFEKNDEQERIVSNEHGNGNEKENNNSYDEAEYEAGKSRKGVDKEKPSYKPGPPIPIPKNSDGSVNLEDARFQCPECTARFLRTDYLINHLDLHHKLDKEYYCHDCNKTFKKKHHFLLHKENGCLSCKLCDDNKNFASRTELINHKREVHWSKGSRKK